MDINKLSEELTEVAKGIMNDNNLELSEDQLVLKLQEEMGELVKAYNRYAGIGFNKENKTKQELFSDMEGEIADVLATVLIYSKVYGVDLERALGKKWLR